MNVWTDLVKNLTTFLILFWLFLVFFSIIKKKSIKESWSEIKEFAIDLLAGDDK